MDLSTGGGCRVLARVDMPAGWQPPLCIAVVDEQHLLSRGIDEDAVRDKVLWRRRRLLETAQLGPRVDPVEDVAAMCCFDVVQRVKR